MVKMNLQCKCREARAQIYGKRALLDYISVVSWKRMLKMYCKYKSVKGIRGPEGWTFGSFSLRLNTEKKRS